MGLNQKKNANWYTYTPTYANVLKLMPMYNGW